MNNRKITYIASLVIVICILFTLLNFLLLKEFNNKKSIFCNIEKNISSKDVNDNIEKYGYGDILECVKEDNTKILKFNKKDKYNTIINVDMEFLGDINSFNKNLLNLKNKDNLKNINNIEINNLNNGDFIINLNLDFVNNSGK